MSTDLTNISPTFYGISMVPKNKWREYGFALLTIAGSDGIVSDPELEWLTLDMAREMGVDEISVIGGAEIYRQTLPVATRLYITEVDAEPEADTFFPDFDRSQWQEAWREPGPPPTDPAISAPDYSFILLTRK